MDNKKEALSSPRKNILQRILLFLFAIPALILLFFLAPEKNSWPLNVLLIILSVPSAFEASLLFGMEPRKTVLRTIGIFFNGSILPIVSFLWVLDIVDTGHLLPIYTGVIMIVLFVQVFHKQGQIKEISSGISKHLSIIVYPGLFMAHLVMISKLPHAAFLYLIMLIAVVANDTAAYLTGQLYRKYHDHPTVLSPNKTTAGFVVGFVFSPVSLLLVYQVWPEIFPGGRVVALIFGLLIGFTTIAGDLIESGLKRSVSRKDSGETIPGRGGLLDSIDSILYTAPVFFYGYQLLNNIWIM